MDSGWYRMSEAIFAEWPSIHFSPIVSGRHWAYAPNLKSGSRRKSCLWSR